MISIIIRLRIVCVCLRLKYFEVYRVKRGATVLNFNFLKKLPNKSKHQ